MSKKLKNMKWESVTVEGFPASVMNNLKGFVALEECTSYGLDKEFRSSKKKKLEIKRKNSSSTEIEVPNKKVKLTNGFVVESCNIAKPSKTNTVENNHNSTNRNSDESITKKKKKQKRKKNKKLQNQPEGTETVEKPTDNKKTKHNDVKHKNKKLKHEDAVAKNKNKSKLGETPLKLTAELTSEDMLSWAEFKLPDSIVKALMEMGFKNPTKIQQLTLPAAIHGRRDILGAAETGSGKTLAFGLPILTGIMKLKEKAEAGLDVYELPYKKNSVKKTQKNDDGKNKIGKGKKNIRSGVNNKKSSDAKESSEDGYSSGDESDENNECEEQEETKPSPEPVKKTKTKLNLHKYKTDKNQKAKEVIDKKLEQLVKIDKNGENYLEEIEVPIRRKKTSMDDENESDDDEKFIHLSDMLDSDDLADDSSDENKGDGSDDEEDDGSEDEENDGEETDSISDNNEEVESEGWKKEENDEGSNEEELNDELENSVNDEQSEASDGDEIDEDLASDASGDEFDETMDETQVGDDEGIGSGMGCVKVIDNIQLPHPVSIKTGKPLFALILTPTRELAIQISRHLIAAAKYTGIRVATIVGGMASVKQERVLRCGPEVVVATPGRLWELITQGQPHLQQLDCVKFLAIDETDRMIERGHFEELHPLLERLNIDDAQRSTRQNFVFSATLTMVHELPAHARGRKVTKRGKILHRKIEKMTPQQKIKRLIDMIGMSNPKVVDITTQNLGTAETLTESRITCSMDQKDVYLYYVLRRHPGRTIVFCNSINSLKRLAQLFTILKCKPLPLHAGMIQRQRLKNLERFRDDPHGVLVATDVAARGLDIPDVDHVIHYQVPRTAENYVHRSGRTARASKEGLTILMMDPSEAYLYAKLCKTLNKTSEVPIFPVAPEALPPIRDLMSLARDLESLELKKRRATQESGWREKVAREMDIIIDEDVIPSKHIDPSIDKAIKAKRRALEALTTRPLFPKGFSFKYPTLNEPTALQPKQENALQVMKNAIESGELKKEKRTGKNASLFKLEKAFQKNKKSK